MRMRMRLSLAALCAMSVAMVASALADEAGEDDLKLQGTWTVTSVVNNGEKLADLGSAEFTFEGDKLVMKSDTRKLSGRFELDWSKKPTHMDMIFQGEQGQDVRSNAIYKIEGKTLTICDARRPGKPRPGAFKSEADSWQTLIVLVKKE